MFYFLNYFVNDKIDLISLIVSQHFFDRKETLHKETLSLISARYLFVISRLLKFQNSDSVLKHWNFLTQTSKTTNTRSNMLDLFFYKYILNFTGSPRRFAVLDLLHKKQSLIPQLLSFAMFFATSGSLALLDSTLRKSAPRDDGFLSYVSLREALPRGNQKKIINKTKFCLWVKRIQPPRQWSCLFFFFSWICSTKISRSLHYRFRSLLFLLLRRSASLQPTQIRWGTRSFSPLAKTFTGCFCCGRVSSKKKRKRMGTKKGKYL